MGLFACGNNASENDTHVHGTGPGQHTHEDGTTHSHEEDTPEGQETFDINNDTLKVKKDSFHTHADGTIHKNH